MRKTSSVPGKKPKKPASEDYFQERPRKTKPPICTDQFGREIKRVGPTSLRRALDNLSNITARSPCDYALVWCEELGVSLSRNGTSIRTAEFYLSACHPSRTLTKVGGEGRDELIKRFLRILKDRKSYAYP